MRTSPAFWRFEALKFLALVVCFLHINGVDFVQGDRRIVNGQPAPPRQWPYAVSLEQSGDPFCVGSLIAPNFVLTAAHCVWDPFVNSPVEPFDLVTVRARYNTTRLTSKGGAILRTVAEVMVASAFTTDFGPNPNDIAIIRLDKSALSFKVPFATLASASYPKQRPGSRVQVAGWGVTELNGPSSKVLRYATVTVTDAKHCQKGPPFDRIDPVRSICASRNKEDACQGDSGGPLLASDGNGAYTVIGTVSWGPTWGPATLSTRVCRRFSTSYAA